MGIVRGPVCCAGGVSGYGNPDYGVVFVGIAAGEDEYKKTHRPFTGPAGRMLDNILNAVGFPREQCYATNICCGWNDHPELTEIQRCFPRLIEELKSIRPKLVIPLGDIPCQVLLGKEIKEVRGMPLIKSPWPWYTMATYHPAAMFHNKEDERIPALIVRDLQKIKNILKLKPRPPIDWRVCQSREEAQDWLNQADQLLSLDIETSNKPADDDESDVWTDRLICIGLYDGKRIPFIVPEEFAHDLDWRSDKVPYGGHNALLFDRNGLRRYIGVDIRFREDSMYQSYSLNEQTGIHRLETLSAEYCGASQYKDATREYYKKHKTPPNNLLYERCAYDVLYTRELIEQQREAQIEDDVRGVYEKLMIPGAIVAADAQWYGMSVDRQAMGDLLVDWIPRQRAIQRRLKEMAGYPEFNPGSPMQVAKVLFEKLGLKPLKRTKTGYSTDRETLETLDHEFVDLLLEDREFTTAITRYIKGIADDIKYDGKLHPVPVLHRTRTGRWAYKDPPMQQIPQDKVKGHPIGLVRKLFVAKDEDHVLLESDYRQIEIWMGAGFSGCSTMFEDLANNYHSVIAQNVLGGLPTDDDWLDKRINAKKVTFGIMYREGEKKLSKKRVGIGCTVAEARAYIARWYARNAEFGEWQKSIDNAILTKGEIVTPFGRKRRFPIVLDHKQLRQGVNFPIQSTASDYTLSSAIVLHDMLNQFNAHILLLIHDSILIEVPRKWLKEVMELVRQVMQNKWIDWLPQVMVDMKVGHSWYEAHEPSELDYELVA